MYRVDVSLLNVYTNGLGWGLGWWSYCLLLLKDIPELGWSVGRLLV